MTKSRKRTLDRIRRLLEEYGELNTATLYDRMKLQKNYQGKVYTNIVTINELSNLLSKNKMFEKCEHRVSTRRLSGGQYRLAIWKLRSDKDENSTNN